VSAINTYTQSRSVFLESNWGRSPRLANRHSPPISTCVYAKCVRVHSWIVTSLRSKLGVYYKHSRRHTPGICICEPLSRLARAALRSLRRRRRDFPSERPAPPIPDCALCLSHLFPEFRQGWRADRSVGEFSSFLEQILRKAAAVSGILRVACYYGNSNWRYNENIKHQVQIIFSFSRFLRDFNSVNIYYDKFSD
jgi:hypothetical protein